MSVDPNKIKKIHEKYPVTRKLKDTEDARLRWAETERVMDTILAIDDGRMPTISESDFINYLLPRLKELNVSEETVDLTIWKQMAGSYDRPIRVVGPDQQELFVVPPIYGDIATVIAEGHGRSIGEAVSDMGMTMQRVPAYAEQILKMRIAPKIKPQPISEEYKKSWLIISERYGLKVHQTAVAEDEVPKNDLLDDGEML